MRRLSVVSVLLLVAAVVGCRVETTSPSLTTMNATDVEVQIGGVDDFNALLAENKGKVILVDFWSTSCGPCLENFPHTVELSNRYREEGLATIAVSMDDPDNLANVKAFLATQQDMDFSNLLSRDGMSQKSAVEFDFGGALPHYRLYDRSGILVESWDGVPEDLEEKIQALLAG